MKSFMRNGSFLHFELSGVSELSGAAGNGAGVRSDVIVNQHVHVEAFLVQECCATAG